MANKVLLKKSSVGARVPVVGDLDYGELALNYADGKLYYKTSSNAIDTFPSLSATSTLTNKTINLGSNTLVATSAQLAAALTDETGSGSLVFATNPVISTPYVSLTVPEMGYTTNSTYVVDNGTLNTTHAGGPFSLINWHDLFAFTKLFNTTYESYNGTTWSSATLNKQIFAQQQAMGGTVAAADGTTTFGGRWTFSGGAAGGTAYGQGTWLVIGMGWNSGTQSTKQVKLESSADGTTWTTRHSSQYQTTMANIFHRVGDYGGDGYLRVTVTWVSGGAVNISNMRLLTSRAGDQGYGSEYMYPYTWDKDQNITTGGKLTVGSSTGLVLTGSSSGTTTVVSTAASSGTLTLPAATDTLVGRATTDTLTNKTLTSPTLTTPALGVATATSINKVAFTAPATGSTLTIADGKTLTASNSLTFTGTDSTSFAFPGTSGTVVTLAATQTLTNKTLTTPIISSISNTGTLTLPTSTDTLVGRATTDTLTNKTLTSPVISGGTINNAIIGGTTAAAGSFTTVAASSTITATGDVLGQYLKSTNSTGDEGGEILLYKPATNSTIAGTGVTIDVYQNKLRIFEQGGTARGVYIDMTAAGAGVSSSLLSGGSTVNSFQTIAVSGQSSVVADSSTDTLTLVAGTGITLTTDATSDSITINSSGGSSGNSFETIAVSGQSSVVADSSTDTLTLAADGVIGIITSPSTDTITFTTNKSFPFTKYDGNASNIPLFTEASALATSLDTVYLPFAKSDGTSVTTLKLTA
jgi:hypothetical protein